MSRGDGSLEELEEEVLGEVDGGGEERERSWRVSISDERGWEREVGVSRICRRRVFADVPY